MKHQPYTYLLTWSKQNKKYYGVRYAKGCHPSDLWNPYKTSSKYVRLFVEEHGDPDIIEIRKVFSDRKSAEKWEFDLLHKIDAANRDDFLNRTNGTKTSIFLSDKAKQNISNAVKSRNLENWKNPDYKEKILSILHSDEVKQKQRKSASKNISNKNLENWQNDDYRQKMTLKSKESMSRRNKENWQNDDYRQKMTSTLNQWRDDKDKVKVISSAGGFAASKIRVVCPICNMYESTPAGIGNHKKKCVKSFQNPKT